MSVKLQRKMEHQRSSYVVNQENKWELVKSTLLIAEASFFNCVSEYVYKEHKMLLD